MKKKREKNYKSIHTGSGGAHLIYGSPPPDKTAIVSAALIIALITFLVYLPALENDFVNWDDGAYVYKNLHIQSLDLKFFRWTFTAVVAANWHPLTIFSFALDHAFWGLNPRGFHLTNLLLHALNTILVFILTIQITAYGRTKQYLYAKKSLFAGIITALLFGIHPLHVESVAWVAERKDVLYAFFFLLSIISYLKYTSLHSKDSRKQVFYGVMFLFFILSLMSKPMAVTLPVVLLILDYYPLERMKDAKRVVLEKVPLFLLSGLSSVITLWAQRTGGAIGTLESYPLGDRIFVAGRAYIFYLYKMLLPVDLAPLYPFPKNINIFTLEYAGSIILFFAITCFCILLSKKRKLFASVWLYYVITLVPVIGIVQVGLQAAADRYTYLPGLGPFMLIGLGVASLYEKFHRKAYTATLFGFAVIIFSLLGYRTVLQTGIWKDSVTLWSYEIRLFPEGAAVSNINLGNAYHSLGRYQGAITEYQTALRLKPDYPEAHYNQGVAYSSLGRYQEAIMKFQTALRLKPGYPEAHINLGAVYGSLGRYQEAIMEFQTALRLKPDYPEARNNLGNAYHSLGRYQEAIRELRTALRLKLYYPKASYNLGNAYKSLGRYQEAIMEYRTALRLKPDYLKAHYNLGIAYHSLGRYQEAIMEYQTALRLKPGYAEARYNLGVIYNLQKRFKDAVREWTAALSINPDHKLAKKGLEAIQDKNFE